MKNCSVLLVTAAALMLASCAQGEKGRAVTPAVPLPTSAGGPLICGLFPKSSVDLIFHGIPSRARITFGPYRNADGSLSGSSCEVVDTADSNQERLADATVTHGINEDVLKTAYGQMSKHLQYFPADLGPGFAQNRADVGVNGRERRIASAGVQWGDYSIVVVIYREARGRVLLKDAVALTQQIGAALRLPKTPSKPYPTPSIVPS